MLMRAPLGVDSLGTQWRQSRWARPPITIRSPEMGRNVHVRPPPAVGRMSQLWVE